VERESELLGKGKRKASHVIAMLFGYHLRVPKSLKRKGGGECGRGREKKWAGIRGVERKLEKKGGKEERVGEEDNS
jgi:hypothetical protein